MTTSRRPAIVVAGPAGVGKSTTGRALATVLAAACLDLDTMTNPLLDLLAEDHGVAGDYADPALAARVREPRYEALTATAAECLEVGCAVVLVAPFTAEREDPQRWGQLSGRLREAGGEPLLVWLTASPAVRLARLQGRGAERDGVFLRRSGGHPPSRDLKAPQVPHLSIDASLPVDEQIGLLLAALSTTTTVEAP